MLSFFGQFMVERGLIDKEQLGNALELMKKVNQSVGELAVERGFISKDEGEEINKTQQQRDSFFGEIAVEKGLLTAEQLENLLEAQHTKHIRIGEALARLGYISTEQVESIVAEYHAEQKQLQGETDLPGWIADDPVSQYILDYYPRLINRMASVPIKVGVGEPWQKSPLFDMQLSMEIKGQINLTIALDVSFTQAREITKGMFGLPDEALTEELITDATGEILNILAGNAKTWVQKKDIAVDIGFPQRDSLPEQGFSFQSVTPEGRGLLIMSKHEE